MSHELSENWIFRYTLSESSICHRRCQKIGKFELDMSHALSENRILRYTLSESSVCHRRCQKIGKFE